MPKSKSSAQRQGGPTARTFAEGPPRGTSDAAYAQRVLSLSSRALAQAHDPEEAKRCVRELMFDGTTVVSHRPFRILSSYETLAPAHWDPLVLTNICKLLLATNDQNLQELIKSYLSNLSSPNGSSSGSAEAALQAAAGEADLHQVLISKPFLHTLWGLLQHPGHSAEGASLMNTLIVYAREYKPNSPASFSSLLRQGAAQPLAAALQHHHSKLTELQQQQPQLSMESMKSEFKGHACALNALISSIFHSHLHGHEGAFYGCECCQARRAHEPAWPDELVSAHLLGIIKMVELGEDYYVSSFNVYPPASLPQAAAVLARTPRPLHELLSYVERTVDAMREPSSSKEDDFFSKSGHAVKFLHNLVATEEGARIKEHPSYLQITASCITALDTITEQIGGGKGTGPKPSPGSTTSTNLEAAAERLHKACNSAGGGAGAVAAVTPRLAAAVEYLVASPSLAKAAIVLATFGGSARADGKPQMPLGGSGVGGQEEHAHGATQGTQRASHGRSQPARSSAAAHSSASMGGASGPQCMPAAVRGPGAGGRGGGHSSSSSSTTTTGAEPSSERGHGTAQVHHKKKSRKCAACGHEGKCLACGRCRAEHYCSAACQRTCWPTHRKVCVPVGSASTQQ